MVTSLTASQESKILEVGIGNAFVSDYLKKIGYHVTTCDFDERLKPDIVADIRELAIMDRDFDIVTAFEVLEHIPFEDFDKTLKKLKEVSSKFVVISLPYRSTSIEFILKIPFGRTFLIGIFGVFPKISLVF